MKKTTFGPLFPILAPAVLLLVPSVTMQLTDEVSWDVADFTVAGALLVGSGLLYMVLARNAGSTRQKVCLGAAILVGLFLVWAELAVGIFGTRFAGT